MYATLTTPALKCRFENQSDQIFYLDKSTGVFRAVTIDTQLFSEASNLVVTFQKVDGRTILNVSAIHRARFSVAFAFFSKSAWILRALVLKTDDAGALGFPLFKTFPNVDGVYEIPDTMNNNLLVLGIHCVARESEVKIQAINAGLKFFGNLKYNIALDAVIISDNMIPQNRRVRILTMFCSYVH